MRGHKAGYVVPMKQPKLDRVLVPRWLVTDGLEQGRDIIRHEQKSPWQAVVAFGKTPKPRAGTN